MKRLLPCASCRRHVLSTEQRCPFCGADRAPPRSASGSGGRVVASAGILTLAAFGLGWNAEGIEPPNPAGGASSTGDAGSAVDTTDAGDAGAEDAARKAFDGDRFVHPLYGMPSPRRPGC